MIRRARWPILFFGVAALAQAAEIPVSLYVVATDRAGHPVTDLNSSDIRVFDDGIEERITEFHLNPPTQPPIVVLLDLMDLSLQQRAAAAQQLRSSLARRQGPEAIYLYLLAPNGTVFPVHPTGDEPVDASWTAGIVPLLNAALREVNHAPPLELAYPIERFKAAYSALDAMEQEISRIPGRKQFTWITNGIPLSVRASEGWEDLTPTLRQLGAQFNRDGTSIYTLVPSINVASLNHEGLEVLTAATGGRTLATIDLGSALKQARIDASASYSLEYAPPPEDKKRKIHTVRVSCERKGVRLLSEQVYFAAVIEPRQQAARKSAFGPVLRPIPHAPAYTFVGVVRSIDAHGMALELDDARYIVIDFKGNINTTPHIGDRVTVRSDEYDGHGLVADSVSVMEAAQPPIALHAAPPAPMGDSILEQARETAVKMASSLPNFLCREVVQRYVSSGQNEEWTLQDTLSANVLYDVKTGEEYRDVRVNGKATRKSWQFLRGDISQGEFGSLLQSVLLSPDPHFEFVKNDILDGVAAREYKFHIDRDESDWKIVSDYQYIVPAYSGRIWFDRDSNRVLKLERSAEEMPEAFPLNSVDSELTFGQLSLGAPERFMLPVKAETRVCVRESRQCSRKIIEFLDYRRFTGESKIIY